MPVDKFGRGEASTIQHTIVSSGDHADDVYLRRDGGNAAIGSISMTGNTVTNVCNPTVDHDVANKMYVDQITSDAVSKNGSTMMGNLDMNGYIIKGLPTPDIPESNSDVASWLQIVNLVRKSTVENETKVSKAGDVMTGDLTLSIDNDERRLLGCQDLTPGKSFSFLLGDAMNRVWYVLREPITIETVSYTHLTLPTILRV